MLIIKELLILLWLLIPLVMHSQTTFFSQEDVDNYLLSCSSCSVINDDLIINGDISNFDSFSLVKKIVGSINVVEVGDHVDWSGFNNVDTITGDFTLSQLTAKFTLNGFNSLKLVNSIIITENESIDSILGFESLRKLEFFRVRLNRGLQLIDFGKNIESVGNDLSIVSNENLERIDGFNELKSIWDEYNIGSNKSLVSVRGFNSLEECGEFNIVTNRELQEIPDYSMLELVKSNLNLSGLDRFKEINGFNSLEHVVGRTRIIRLDSLEIISGFKSYLGGNDLKIDLVRNLKAISGFNSISFSNVQLYIGETGLVDLSFLSTLTCVTGELLIIKNSKLSDISHLSNLNALKLNYLSIEMNNSLSTCHEKWVCDYIRAGTGNARIQDNLEGCNSVEEILAGCIVDVDEEELETFSIYPNPCNDFLIIEKEVSRQNTFTILDKLGQILDFGELQNNRVDVSKLGTGIYFLQLKDDTKSRFTTQKFIKL